MTYNETNESHALVYEITTVLFRALLEQEQTM